MAVISSGTERDHRQTDHRVGNAQGRRDQRAVIDQELGAEGDRRRADDQHQQLLPQRSFLDRLLFLLHSGSPFRVLFHLGDGERDISEKQAEEQHAVPAGEAPGRVGNACIQRRGEEKGRYRQPQRLAVNDRQRRDERGVADDRSDGVAVGNAAVADQCRLRGHHDLRERRADGNDRCADQQLRQMKAVRNAHRAVHEPVAALDEQHETKQKQ